MRLIDADALIEGYKHMGYDPEEHPEESYMNGWCKGFNAAVDHCIHHAIHAPTVSAEPQWIPCSERYPEENQICIVTDETMRNTYEYRFCKETYDENQGWTYLKHRITAWMPLPEPYREENR